VILSALLQKKKQQHRQNRLVLFNNPVAEATDYNHVTPAGVLGLS